MARYIDKEKLLLAFGEEPLVWTDRDDEIQERNDYRYYKALVNGMPIADVEEVRHGKWIPNELETSQQQYFDGVYQVVTKRLTPISYKCSLCGRVEEYQEPYCNCGAKMEAINNDL